MSFYLAVLTLYLVYFSQFRLANLHAAKKPGYKILDIKLRILSLHRAILSLSLIQYLYVINSELLDASIFNSMAEISFYI